MAKFNERLRECRKKAGLRQQDASHELDIQFSTYCRYEVGGSEPTISVASRIADYFGVTLDYLAGRTDE